ncbi:MAG TPA: YggT family protein [Polyangiaceae bacterium]|nr:YggT family protein [Polyangiaceae bacterium]
MFLLAELLDLYAFLVIVSVALSWLRLSPENPVVRFVRSLTEPALAPIRKRLPAVGGFDLSPLVLILLLELVKRLVVRL